MNEKSLSGAELEKAMREGGLNQATAVLTGMVKASEKNGHIGFSQSGCHAWVDLPTKMIEHAQHIGHRSCQDHSHPWVKITLKEPDDPEGRVLLSLLAHSMPEVMTYMADGGFADGGFMREGMLQAGSVPGALPGTVPAGDGVSIGAFPDAPVLPATRSSMGDFGFGSTLPSCRYVRRRVVCGSALPGYPVPMCDVWVYCCTWPNGTTGCM